MGDEYGPWDALTLDEAVELFEPAPLRWWVTGGHALEMHLERSWRDHEDTDVSFVRAEAGALRSHLAPWDIWLAADGVLSPWSGAPLDRALHHNNLWCRRSSGAWGLDLTVSDGDASSWIFRRDHTLRLPWDRAVLRSEAGVPYLAPELQMLFESRDLRPKDELDAAEVLPALDTERARFLAARLTADHPWQAMMIHGADRV